MARKGTHTVHVRDASSANVASVGGGVVPWPLIACVAALVALGLATVRVAVAGDSDYSFNRQVLGVVLGVVAMVVMWVVDYRTFERLLVPLLVIDVILILLPMVPGLGVEKGGATSWVSIAGFSFQPSEFAKPVTILMIAAGCSRFGGRISRGRDYLKVLALVFVPFLLLFTEDLGTALVIFIFGFLMLLVAGASWRWLAATAGVLIVVVAGVLGLNGAVSSLSDGSVVLVEDYQMSRLLVFVDPDNPDYADDAYNLNQAEIAVGSGEVYGKGYGNATQSSSGFLPEPATDFIFCVYAEQFGFMGSFVLLALYLALLASAALVGRRSSDLFGTLVTAGVMGMWTFQIVENIGMDIGLMPITGIPLPFLSYGSSFMLTNFVCVGLLCSVWTRRGDVLSRGKKPSKTGRLELGT